MELLLQGGALMPNAMRRGAKGQGLCFPSLPLLWRGGWSKQQQKHHPLGDCGLHPLPSLRSVFASYTSPTAPYGFRKAPNTLWGGGTLWLARGSTVPTPGHSLSWLLTIPPKGGGEGMKPSPRGGWHCPGPASRLWHCPDSSFAPLGLTPYAGQILPATPPCPTPCLSPSWPQAFPKTACAWAPCPPASPHRNGPGLCLLSGGGVAA